MPSLFAHGYAVLIGVDQNAVATYALPDVAKDVTALALALTHPQRCAYAPEHVQSVTGAAATRQGILDALEWLRQQIAADTSGNATAVVYYSGHGWRDASATPLTHYLIPYDMTVGPVRTRALRAADFAEEVSGLRPRRLLVILDCCHAAGMEVKGAAALPTGFAAAALSPALLGEEGAPVATPGAKGLEALQQGAGRAVLSSSQGTQPSYVRHDHAMSIFTYHLIEALTGHAQPAAGATEVLVSDVMGHVTRAVPASARAEYGVEQLPDYQVSGNFPVALLLGGKGLSKGLAAPDPLAPLDSAASQPATQINTGGGAYVGGTVNTGGGDFVGRDKIVTAGSRGVAVGGNITGGTIITGDR